MPFIIRVLIAPVLASPFLPVNKSREFTSLVTASQVGSSTHADGPDNENSSFLFLFGLLFLRCCSHSSVFELM